jgi:beta-glucosidase
MRLRLVLLVFILAALIAVPIAGSSAKKRRSADPAPIYLNHSYSPAERAADLVSRMTLTQKASQMNSSQAPAIAASPSIPTGVSAYGWWNEALHGVSRLQLASSGNSTVLDNTTSYPISLTLGSSWDPNIMYQEASAISDEAREVVPTNSLNLDFYSPTVNLGRDPRWGRNDEVFSEDPLLTADMASQFVDGLEVREYYTAQFKQIIQQSHPGSIMSAYNSVNNIPSPCQCRSWRSSTRAPVGMRSTMAATPSRSPPRPPIPTSSRSATSPSAAA